MTENPEFPLAAPPFAAHTRDVDVAACFDWLRQGWAMFLLNPGIWIGTAILLLVMLMAISIVPLFGQIAAHLLVPLFGAGMVQICRRLDRGEQPEISDLFAGFRHNAGQLVMVGVFFAISVFAIAFIAFLLVSGGILGGTVTGRVGGFGIAMGGVMLAGLLVMVLSIPIIMATWYAPFLVFIHDMHALPAMKASFAAGYRNLLPTVIFGIFLVVALFFAMLPLGLGMVLLLPVFSGAVYASYRDVFVGV